MEATMQIPTKSLSALILVLLAAACGSANDPDSTPAANGGGVVQGSVMGGGSQNMRVAVPSSSAATTTGSTGGFVLTDVPKGAAALQFSGGGQSATLATAAVVPGEFRRLTVSISGASVTEHSEQTETEFEGTVDAIDGMVLTVAGRKVAVTDATKIRKDDAAATFADLVLGAPVEVEGTLNADASVTASEISIEDKADRVVFVGTLTQIAGNTLTVGGRTVNVGSATVIVKGDTTLTLADLKVGDHVLVRGVVQADKSVNATRIRVLPREDEPEEEMHVSGKVAAVGANTFTIGDTVISVDAKTEFEGNGLHGLADLKLGDFVFAEVMKQADGSLLAEEVKRFTPPMPG
jgi:hypothetical protein